MTYSESNNSTTFCIMPFTHINTKTNGEFKLCCRSLPLYNVKEKSLLEVWNSDKYKRIRKQCLSNERPEECQECFYLEDKGIRSMRQRQNILKCEYDNHLRVLDDLKDDYSMPDRILSIELKLNNLCNLKCRMCHPVDSTKWAKDWPLIEELQRHNEWTYQNVKKYNLMEHPYICEWDNHPQFFKDLESISDTIETIWFAGGEPLIDPLHFKFLDSLKDKRKNIKLQYATNLTSLTFKGESIIDNYWAHFKGVLVGVSMDGLGDVFNYIRTNADFDSVMNNMFTVRNIAEKEELNIKTFAACTFQALNIFDLPKIFKYLNDNKIWIHTHRVTYPRFLSCQVLPKELKRKVSLEIEKYIKDLPKPKPEEEVKLIYYKNSRKNAIDNLKFMNGDDLSDLWSQFLEYNRILDKAVGSKSLEEIRPEIKEYI